MKTGLFIRGRWDGKGWGAGPFYFRFPISDRQTAYEWPMVLDDRHPYPHYFAVFFGDLKAETVAGMHNREKAVQTISGNASAIYRELRAEFEAGRLNPLRREYCSDRRDHLDFTRCVFAIGPILDLVRRRGDNGWLIGKLLRAHANSETLRQARSELTPIGRLAELIFSRHSETTPPRTFETLYEAAKFELEGVTKAAFLAAYRSVYATQTHRPAAAGWPLKSPYKERWQAGRS